MAGLTVELKILDARLLEWGLPRYQTAMAAAIDLHACVDGPTEVCAGEPPILISSGLAVHIGDPLLAALVLPRSGLGHRRGLVLGNLVGLIDADYIGPVMVSAWNRSAAGAPPVVLNPGERFAQMVFVPIVRPDFKVVERFSAPSGRGGLGFGSTGTT